ncbi:ninjurin-1-like isoform X2 [Liolophura sinensis]|uniref:ninjurin-1-like isoform X2 n=1 Tax=Liolophura sinensis TaxID=3198878 RepID=UPI0031583C96
MTCCEAEAMSSGTGVMERAGLIPQFNKYATKKTLAQGLMDVALLMANASQLKALLNIGPSHEFYYIVLGLLIVSIILQVITGILLLVLGTLDITDKEKQKAANALNNVAVCFIFLITVVNIFVSSFGIKMTEDG